MCRGVFGYLRGKRGNNVLQYFLGLGKAVGKTAAHVVDVLLDVTRQRVQTFKVVPVILLSTKGCATDHVTEISVKSPVSQKGHAPAFKFGQRYLVPQNKRQQFCVKPIFLAQSRAVYRFELIQEGRRFGMATLVVSRCHGGNQVIVVKHAGAGGVKGIFLHFIVPVLLK